MRRDSREDRRFAWRALTATAIVVGVATTALGLALVVRINESYGTIEEDDIREKDEAP